MSLEWIGPVAVLALIDSASVGTLVIPLWLMLAPRVRASRLLVYLGTVVASYLLLGLVIAAGLGVAADALASGLDSTPGRWLRLVLGVALLVLGATIEPLDQGRQGQACGAA